MPTTALSQAVVALALLQEGHERRGGGGGRHRRMRTGGAPGGSGACGRRRRRGRIDRGMNPDSNRAVCDRFINRNKCVTIKS